MKGNVTQHEERSPASAVNAPSMFLLLLDQRSHSAHCRASGWYPGARPDPCHGGSRPSPWATAICLILCFLVGALFGAQGCSLICLKTRMSVLTCL